MVLQAGPIAETKDQLFTTKDTILATVSGAAALEKPTLPPRAISILNKPMPGHREDPTGVLLEMCYKYIPTDPNWCAAPPARAGSGRPREVNFNLHSATAVHQGLYSLTFLDREVVS